MGKHLIEVSLDKDLTKFEPAHFDLRDKARDLAIDKWARLKDWPRLEENVDEKIEEIEIFCAWWEARVRRPGNQPNNADQSYLTLRNAEQQTGVRQQTVSAWNKELQNKPKFRAKIILAASRKAGFEPAENHRAEGTGENEWYTPIQYIEAARKVLGEIDLDPASSLAAQENIQARAFFTKAEDGLMRQWHGRVWLNPPYAQPFIWNFVEKLVLELTEARVTEAILLTHSYTDTAWFHHAEAIAASICFTRGRIKFVDPDGEECAPTQGQAFFYYGENQQRFGEVFREFGFIR